MNDIDKSKPLIYWLGGSTCAGKTTISNVLADEYGFIVYHCDDYIGQHVVKSNNKEHPNLNRITGMCWNEILNMTINEYLEWSIGSYKEEFEMIVEDLHQLYDGVPILVEGVDILPELIESGIVDVGHAIWIVSDEGFYREKQMGRKELFERVNECLDPKQALENYFSYDLALGRYIKDNAKRHGFNVIEVKGESDLTNNVEAVRSHFRLS